MLTAAAHYNLFLAQRFDDWFELALMAVVIIGTLVANAWTEWSKRRQRNAEHKDGVQPPKAGLDRPLPPVAAPGTFEFPTARPMPPRPPRPDQQPRPTVAPRRASRGDADDQLRRRTADVPPKATPPPVQPRRAERIESGRPMSVEPPRRKRDAARASTATQARTQSAERKAGTSSTARPELAETLNRHIAEQAEREEMRIGHADDGYNAPITTERIEDVVAEGEIGTRAVRSRLTAREIRKGIILAEILAKPVALRQQSGPSN